MRPRGFLRGPDWRHHQTRRPYWVSSRREAGEISDLLPPLPSPSTPPLFSALPTTPLPCALLFPPSLLHFIPVILVRVQVGEGGKGADAVEGGGGGGRTIIQSRSNYKFLPRSPALDLYQCLIIQLGRKKLARICCSLVILIIYEPGLSIVHSCFSYIRSFLI